MTNPSTLVVLDPAGTAAHGTLPATWRPFAAEHPVVWCAVSDTDPRAALGRTRGPVDLLAAGSAADSALELAAESPDRVGRVLLVDPGAHGAVAAGHPAHRANDEWMSAQADRRQALAAQGVEVVLVAHSDGGGRDRVPAPIPLGHPDVLAAVRAALGSGSSGERDAVGEAVE
ncbi:hypothetical protein [Alloactinosynnema sp. L-07]|uniref:hypothetical protein n=1 Tax=Alloactinosynnema sp. L-07 TaxID=1653480 RepID=UPI0012FBB93A|nr:hypothetical protein [Alloactinosynnema sp. L-07]